MFDASRASMSVEEFHLKHQSSLALGILLIDLSTKGKQVAYRHFASLKRGPM
jgi:tRNA U34 5-carboxymethylaminomethyl modifying enzyme MnmG/GidA